MANPIKGQVGIDIDGKRYTVQLGFYALTVMERKLDVPWHEHFKRGTEGKWRLNDVLVTFHATLARAHPTMTEMECADLIDAAGLLPVTKVLVESFELSMPTLMQGQGGEETANPTLPGGNGIGASFSEAG